MSEGLPATRSRKVSMTQLLFIPSGMLFILLDLLSRRFGNDFEENELPTRFAAQFSLLSNNDVHPKLFAVNQAYFAYIEAMKYLGSSVSNCGWLKGACAQFREAHASGYDVGWPALRSPCETCSC